MDRVDSTPRHNRMYLLPSSHWCKLCHALPYTHLKHTNSGTTYERALLRSDIFCQAPGARERLFAVGTCHPNTKTDKPNVPRNVHPPQPVRTPCPRALDHHLPSVFMPMHKQVSLMEGSVPSSGRSHSIPPKSFQGSRGGAGAVGVTCMKEVWLWMRGESVDLKADDK